MSFVIADRSSDSDAVCPIPESIPTLPLSGSAGSKQGNIFKNVTSKRVTLTLPIEIVTRSKCAQQETKDKIKNDFLHFLGKK